LERSFRLYGSFVDLDEDDEDELPRLVN
jgi:hypothetical protein